MNSTWRCFLVAFGALLAPDNALSQHADRGGLETAFEQWLETEIWPEARANGISRPTFERAFRGVTLDFDLPELVVPGAPDVPAIDQPEFRSPALYFREDNLIASAQIGRGLYTDWSQTLTAVERQYGVPGPIVLAVWGRETAFGREDLPHDAVRALATASFLGRRPAHFRIELIAALIMLERGDISREAMRSSWAGALGQPQLLPTGYLQYAVDFDGDGRRDIWHTVPDVLATIANFLSSNGWDGQQSWGVEVALPTPNLCLREGPMQGLAIAAWHDLGVDVDSGLGATRSIRFLLAPAGTLGPAFLVSQNFYVLKEYNFSDLYALFVVHLADRISGINMPFSSAWQPIETIDHAQIQRMQRKLEALGYDVGGADGLVGFRTRVAVGSFQQRVGLPVTCFPNSAVFAALAG